MLIVLTLAAAARAEEPAALETDVCVLAFERGQEQRRLGELREARDQLLLCAQSSCPEMLRERCLPWLEEVRATIPTIIVAAKDSSGADLVEARVLVDGEVVAERLDGRPIELDPGPRHLVIEREGAEPVKRDLVIVQGETGRRLDVVLRPRRSPTPRAPEIGPSRVPSIRPDEPAVSTEGIVSYTFLAIGLSALVAGSITGALSLQRAADLRHQCGGTTCTPQFEPAYDEGLVLAHVASACFALTGAAFVTSITAWALDDRGPRVTALFGPTEIGLRGRF